MQLRFASASTELGGSWFEFKVSVTAEDPGENVVFCVSAPSDVTYLGPGELENSEAERFLMDVQPPKRLESGLTECWTVGHMRRGQTVLLKFDGQRDESSSSDKEPPPKLDVSPQKGFSIRRSSFISPGNQSPAAPAPSTADARPTTTFDGDTGLWYVPNAEVLASSSDLLVPGDYDGDTLTDIAFYRPSNGTWNVLQSSTNFVSSLTFALGTSIDQPAPGDYDGDGKTDPAVFHPASGSFQILRSSAGYASTNIVYGASGDVPVPGDYEGEGKTDAAVYRPSNGIGPAVATPPFGSFDTPTSGQTEVAGSIAVAGWALDDSAVDRVEIWRDLAVNETTVPFNSPGHPGHGLGLSSDRPVPGDYDGGRLRDTVTNAGGGAGLGNVSVNVYTISGTWVMSGSTYLSGVYTSYAGLPTGSYYLKTSNSAGFIDEMYDDIVCVGCSVTTSSGAAVAVAAPNTTASVNFALSRRGRISGRLTDGSTGAGLLGVTIEVYKASDAGYTRVASGYTAANGLYTTSPALPAGSYFVRTLSDKSWSCDDTFSTSTSFAVGVTAVNDAPTITAIAHQDIDQKTSTSPLAFTVGDVETAVGALTVSVSSSNLTLVPAGNIQFSGAFANRTVTLIPTANTVGTTKITLTVSDGSLTTSREFYLSVRRTGQTQAAFGSCETRSIENGGMFVGIDSQPLVANESATGQASDPAGSIAAATPTGINVDQTKPKVIVIQTPVSSANRWNSDPATAVFACPSTSSAIAACPPAQVNAINGANAVTATENTFLYDGGWHPATAMPTAVGGVAVSGSFAFTYTPGGSAALVNVSTYSATATFKISDPNYDAILAPPENLMATSRQPGGVLLNWTDSFSNATRLELGRFDRVGYRFGLRNGSKPGTAQHGELDRYDRTAVLGHSTLYASSILVPVSRDRVTTQSKPSPLRVEIVSDGGARLRVTSTVNEIDKRPSRRIDRPVVHDSGPLSVTILHGANTLKVTTTVRQKYRSPELRSDTFIVTHNRNQLPATSSNAARPYKHRDRRTSRLSAG